MMFCWLVSSLFGSSLSRGIDRGEALERPDEGRYSHLGGYTFHRESPVGRLEVVWRLLDVG